MSGGKRQSCRAAELHWRRFNLDNSLHVRSKVAWIGTLHDAFVRLLGFLEGRADHNVGRKGFERRKPRWVSSLYPSSDWHPVPDLLACWVQFPSPPPSFSLVLLPLPSIHPFFILSLSLSLSHTHIGTHSRTRTHTYTHTHEHKQTFYLSISF